jgi:hypothetical protein
MANSKQILDRVARNLDQLGLAYTRSGNNVVLTNGSNAITVSYIDASILSPMGGVSPASAPYLGIGVGNPGQIQLKSSSTAADNISDVIDSVAAATLLHMVSGFANDIILENSDATFSTRIRGQVDLLGMGQ